MPTLAIMCAWRGKTPIDPSTPGKRADSTLVSSRIELGVITRSVNEPAMSLSVVLGAGGRLGSGFGLRGDGRFRGFGGLRGLGRLLARERLGAFDRGVDVADHVEGL